MIDLQNIVVGYGRSTVLHDVSVLVRSGGVTVVLGHNGAGKSTLLRTAIGLLSPQSGRVLLGALDITRMKPHQRVAHGIAYVPQGQQSFGNLTAAENLRLVADGRKGGAAAVAEALDMFPALREVLGKRAGLLSGGQRQQLAIARALITRPKLLLLDEPTEGIQPSVVAEIEESIISLARQSGISVLLVEQQVGVAARAGDYCYVLEAGRVTHGGPVEHGSEAQMRQLLAV